MPGREPLRFMEAAAAATVIQAKRLCRDVYVQAGYITEQAADFAPDPGNGDTYVVAGDAAGNVVGTLRLSVAHPCGIISAWQGRLYHQAAALIAAAQRGPSFEIGSLAVRKDCAPLKVSWGLYDFAYRWALARGLDYGIVSMDVRAFRALGLAGWHAVPIGAPMHYLGSLTVPAVIPIRSQPAAAAAKAQAWLEHSPCHLPRI